MLLCIVACRLSAFLAVWCGQTEREASLCNLKLHTARFRVAVGQLTDRGEAAAVRGQPVLQVGVVGADMDKGVFLVKYSVFTALDRQTQKNANSRQVSLSAACRGMFLRFCD